MSARISMRDVARHSGFSVTAVSKALNGKTDISSGCRERILSSCRELGYRINPSLQDFIRETTGGTNRNISFILVNRRLEDPAYAFILSSVSHEVVKCGYFMMLETVTGNEKDMYDLPPLLRDGRVGGIIVTGALNAGVMEAFRELRIPLCMLGEYPSELVNGTLNVYPDDTRMIEITVAELLRRGRRHFSYYEESPESLFSKRRLTLFRHMLSKAGIPPESCRYYNGNGPLSGIPESLRKDISSAQLPFDAMFCWDARGARMISVLLNRRYGDSGVPATIVSIFDRNEDPGMDFIRIEQDPALEAFAVRRFLARIESKDFSSTEQIKYSSCQQQEERK